VATISRVDVDIEVREATAELIFARALTSGEGEAEVESATRIERD
jgi:hypothetical protein